jgi:tripeptide aminopeptidase
MRLAISACAGRTNHSCGPRELMVSLLAGCLLGCGAERDAMASSDLAYQEHVPPVEAQYHHEVERLLERDDVRESLRYIEATDDRTVRDQVELTEIPSPPFGEEARGLRYATLLREYGADSVWIDPEGNVIGVRRGTSGDRSVALAGHLDTVFPEGTELSAEMRGDTVFAPGISDNGRGLTTVLAVLRGLNHAGTRTPDNLLFIGTVGETGLGDLRGVKELFGPDGPGIDAFISVDASGSDHVVHKGPGSRR